MKLKNILIAAMATLLFAGSCSKDSGMDLPGNSGNAKLNLRIQPSGIGMKADGDVALDGESLINNVGVALFSTETGLLLTTPYWGVPEVVDGVVTVLNIPSNSEKANIVIVANCPQALFSGLTEGSSYKSFQEALAQLSDQNQSNLTMSSQVITTQNALSMGDNYLGYASQGNNNINGISSPVELTRLASRIDLVSVTTSFRDSKLAGRTVRINRIYIANEKKASYLFSENYWGVVMAAANLGDSEATTIRRTVSDNAPLSETIYSHYVMENDGSEQPTQLVINATLEETDGYGAETKSFAATVNLNGVLSQMGVVHKYIKRNHVYRLNVNFSGSSFSGDPEPPTPPTPPVTGLLDVKVEVVGWGPVNQGVEIE